MRALIVALLALMSAAPAARAADAPDYLAAGYKALFTCSATFLADRSPEQIARNEFVGVYPDYVTPIQKLPVAQIERRHGWGSVMYDALMPPRIALYRD